MATSILENACCLDLTFRRPGIRRKGNLDLITCEANKDLLGLSKAILDSPEYKKIVGIARETRQWVEKRGLPSPLKRGTYLIPLAVLDSVYEKIDNAEQEFKDAVDAFIAVYPDQKAKAEVELRDQYNEMDYPEPETLRHAFGIERRLLDFGVPGQSKIGRFLYEKEKAREEQTWANATDEIQEALRLAFKSLVGNLADQLEPKEDGSRKRLTSSAVDKLGEFLELFQHRNLTDDADLEGLVIQARNVLNGKSAETIKKSDTIRGEVAGEMARVLTALDKLLEAAPRRAIMLDDDAAA